MPNNVLPKATEALRLGEYFFKPYDGLYYAHMVPLMSKGWKFYLVDQSRGWCKYAYKEIAIPKWLFSNPSITNRQAKIVQYQLHEIAHAMVCEKYGLGAANKMPAHGKQFMDILIEICPPELLIFEMSYKPANLVKAGAVFAPESLGF
jgi:hypothetical protein